MAPKGTSDSRRAGKLPVPPNGNDRAASAHDPTRHASTTHYDKGTELFSYADALMSSHSIQESDLASMLTPSKQSGTSVMRADIGAATSSAVDVREAQWRADVNRQAQT